MSVEDTLRTLELIVPGEPIAQPRVKGTSFGGHVRMYTPTKNGIADYKALIRLIAKGVYSGEPLDVPFVVDCEFVFSRPGRLVWKKRPMPRIPMPDKRDRDNLDKAVLDALALVVWKNDKLVYDGRVSKWYAAGDEQPHTKITIRWECRKTGEIP